MSQYQMLILALFTFVLLFFYFEILCGSMLYFLPLRNTKGTRRIQRRFADDLRRL